MLLPSVGKSREESPTYLPSPLLQLPPALLMAWQHVTGNKAAAAAAATVPAAAQAASRSADSNA